MRAFAIALVCLFGFEASGAAYVAAAECRDGCPDDDAGGRCPPACACCSCCVHAVSSIPAAQVTAVMPPPISDFSFSPDEIQTSSPDPSEIFHIPKLALA